MEEFYRGWDWILAPIKTTKLKTMPRGRKKLVEETNEEKDTESPVEIENVSQVSFSVFDAKGDFVREYTVEASGKDAGKMARVFAEEINGFVK